MNIHFIISDGIIANIDTGTYRRRTGNYKPSKAGTKPPRTREGKEFPGGKHMRRAYKELNRRRKAHEDTVSGMRKGKSINPLAFQKPGSMKVRAR